MLEIKSKEKNYGINFPTSLNEITPEYLTTLTDNISLPKYYAVVALCFEVKLFDFATNIRSNKPGTSSVVPLLAKVDLEQLNIKNASIGDKLIVDRSSLERGHHLNIPTMISSNNANAYLKEDEKLMINIIKGTVKDATITDPIVQNMVDNKHKSIFVLEFKIVPVADIAAVIPINSKTFDPFKVKRISTDKAEVN